MLIRPYALPRVRHPFYEQRKSACPDCEAARSGWHPYLHQAFLLDEWNQHDAFVLTTKTGSGKTQAAALPILANGESAFFIYPTNALIEDQQRSILQLAKGLGWTPYVYEAGKEFDRVAFNRADVLLVRVDADNLEKLRCLSRFRTKGRTLLDILNLGVPTIVLTNPDTLFLILALRYGEGMAIWASLSQYHTLVVDEFHLYGGVELAHLLFMLHYCRANGFFGGRTVLLSATPDKGVDDLLESILAPYRVKADAPVPYPQVDERTVAYAIDLVPLPTGNEPVDAALTQFEQLRPELERLLIKSTGDYVPLVIIFNSVMAAMYAADLLREKYGVPPEKIGEYRGLMDQRLRSFTGKLVVIGTSAIEVGVDFNCHYLIFEAGDAASFMQRFGRVGRHAEGTAFLLAPPNVLRDLQATKGGLTRDELECAAHLWYAENDARPWFARTPNGLLTVALLAHRLVEEIAADRSATPETVGQGERKVEATLCSYVTRIDATHSYGQVCKWLRLLHNNPRALPWLHTYANNMAFRTTSVTLQVHDIREERRRVQSDGSTPAGDYGVDLHTLLSRGKDLALTWDASGQPRITICGYTRASQAEAVVDIGSKGILYSTQQLRDEQGARLLLTKDGKTSRLSDILAQEDHVFVVVPNDVATAIDWRIAVFRHPQGFLAFDGDALLLKEIYEHLRESVA